ncbi:hypothetical protein, partial [Bacillus cereus]|uniref:hypothetical protein n=1 Tax=Bacillus cereus TaxID=1396 RepID=UPI001155F7D9
MKEFESLLGNVKKIVNSNTEKNNEVTNQVLESLSSQGGVFKEVLEKTINQFVETKELVRQVEHERELIELESYNNYKLMANGLVTEVLTHELHSILTNFESQEDIGSHLKSIEDHLLLQGQYHL